MNIKNKLNEIGLTSDNSIVIGSGILSVLSIRESKDIDIVVDEDTYTRLSSNDGFEKAVNHGREVLTHGLFEIGTSWRALGRSHNLNDFLSNSTVIDGVRHITLKFLLEAKKSWLKDGDARQKDIEEIKLMED